MNGASFQAEAAVQNLRSGSKAVQKLVESWIASCNEFRLRERREIIEQIPSVEKLAEYRHELKWMLRSARALINLISDPDYPAREYLAEISGKLLQLEASWESLNNPLTDEQAGALLHEHFQHDVLVDKLYPDEKRTGSAA